MKTIKHLNKIAAADNLELIKGQGYFYWWGTNDEMESICSMLSSTSVYTCHFNQMTFDQWLTELVLIKDKIKNRNPFSEID